MSWKDLYPFHPNYTTTPDGYRLHYVEQGEGAPMVMLHGNPTWSFIYRQLIPAAAQAGYHAYALDNLGCGLSDKPQDWPYRLEGHIRNLEKWVDDDLQLKDITLVLHDWGGCIGMGYAVRHPEKIRRIVLMNTAAFLSEDCPKRVYLGRCPFLGAFLIRGCNAFVEGAIRMAAAKRLPKDVADGYRAPYGNWHDRIATQRFIQDIPFKPSHPTWSTLQYIQEHLFLLQDKPVTLLWGAQDFCLHTGFFDRWRKIYPHARAVSLPEASHYLLEDAPERVIQEILHEGP